MGRSSSFELLLGRPRGLVVVEAMVIGVTGLYVRNALVDGVLLEIISAAHRQGYRVNNPVYVQLSY